VIVESVWQIKEGHYVLVAEVEKRCSLQTSACPFLARLSDYTERYPAELPSVERMKIDGKILELFSKGRK
jgi:hypothetical protein